MAGKEKSPDQVTVARHCEWISIVLVGHTRTKKTHVWWVVTNTWSGSRYKTSILLGKIKWHTGWRRYAFYPEKDTVFEQVCLRDIAEFIDDMMKEKKQC